MITVNHLRQFGVLKRELGTAKSLALELADHITELEKAMEALAYQLIEDNRDDMNFYGRGMIKDLAKDNK